MIVNMILHGLSKKTNTSDVRCITTKIKKNKRIDEIRTFLDENGKDMTDINNAAETIINQFNLESVELPAKIDKNELFVFNLT